MIGGSLFFGHGDDDGLIVAMMRNDQLGYNLAHVLSQSLIYACLVVRFVQIVSHRKPKHSNTNCITTVVCFCVLYFFKLEGKNWVLFFKLVI